MAIRRKTRSLFELDVDIDELANSKYFNISNLSDNYGIGEHVVYIRGSKFLKPRSFLYVSIYDEDNKSLKINSPQNELNTSEDYFPSKRISFVVDDEVKSGIATFVAVGELKTGEIIRYKKDISINKAKKEPLLANRNQWAEDTFYRENDVVNFLNDSYISLIDHTSTAQNSPVNEIEGQETHWKNIKSTKNIERDIESIVSSSSLKILYSPQPEGTYSKGSGLKFLTKNKDIYLFGCNIYRENTDSGTTKFIKVELIDDETDTVVQSTNDIGVAVGKNFVEFGFELEKNTTYRLMSTDVDPSNTEALLDITTNGITDAQNNSNYDEYLEILSGVDNTGQEDNNYYYYYDIEFNEYTTKTLDIVKQFTGINKKIVEIQQTLANL